MLNETGKKNPSDKVKKIFDGLTEKERQEMSSLLQENGKTNTTDLGKSSAENTEIPQDLKDFRKSWIERIERIDDEAKERIIKATEKIKPNVILQEDGSKLIEFNLGGKKWKILDPKLDSHTNQSDDYVHHTDYDSITNIKKDEVRLRGMRGDYVNDRRNKELVDYVKEKQGEEGLHIPSEEEMRKLLAELGKEINSDQLSDQIAMLMYLTGMDGGYRLSMRDSSSRSILLCLDNKRKFHYYFIDFNNASLCMIACEKSDA